MPSFVFGVNNLILSFSMEQNHFQFEQKGFFAHFLLVAKFQRKASFPTFEVKLQ